VPYIFRCLQPCRLCRCPQRLCELGRQSFAAEVDRMNVLEKMTGERSRNIEITHDCRDFTPQRGGRNAGQGREG